MKKFIKKTIALYLCAILIIFSFQPTNVSADTYMGYKDFKKTTGALWWKKTTYYRQKIFFLLFICLAIFAGCSNTSDTKLEILSKNLYSANVYKWIDKENQTFQIPLITNKKFSEFSIQSIEGRNFDEKYLTYEIEEQERYNGYYIYMILFQIDTAMFQAGKDVSFQSFKVTLDDITLDYDFGEILIQDEIVNNENELVSYIGQGVMYPEISALDMDIHSEKDVVLKDVTLSNHLSILNKEQFLKKYKSGQDINLGFIIDTKSAADTYEFYCYDVCLNFSDGVTDHKYYGISSISTIVLDKSKEYIDSLGE